MSLALAGLIALWQGHGQLVGRAPQSPSHAGRLERQRPPAAANEPRRETQINAVIDSMQRTGRPPAGIAQGGRHGGDRGVFENFEGRLPAQPRGYYTETDVWPRGPDGRGAERLIFGRGGEVWYSGDHYRSFERVR